MTMRGMILATTLMALPFAGAQAQPIPPNCQGVLELSGWQSKTERGYWASSGWICGTSPAGRSG